MSSIGSDTQLTTADSKSKTITQCTNINNPKPMGFLGQLAYLMDNQVFRDFIHEYFSKWDDTKASIMLIQHYTLIDDEYYRRTGQRLNSEQIASILKEMIDNGDCRRLMVDSTNKFLNDGSKTIRDLYKNIEIQNNDTVNQIKLIKE